MKRSGSLFVSVLLVAFLVLALAGCGGDAVPENGAGSSDSAKVPDVIGMSAEEASSTVAKTGMKPLVFSADEHAGIDIFRFEPRDSGDTVTLTDPVAGKMWASGMDVSILVGESESPPAASSIEATVGPFWFQHKYTVAKLGEDGCVSCHDGTYCAKCHGETFGDGSSSEESWSVEGDDVARSVAGYAIRTVGEGSADIAGLRSVSGKRGGVMKVEITARPVATAMQVREDTAKIASHVFAFHGPKMVKSLEFVWYLKGSDTPVASVTIANGSATRVDPGSLLPELQDSDLR